jgi:hypothetical protein
MGLIDWLTGLFSAPTPAGDDEWRRVIDHPRFDGRTLSVRFPPAELRALPLVEVDADRLYNLMLNFSFVKVGDYPVGFEVADREVGHDLEARYVLIR